MSSKSVNLIDFTYKNDGPHGLAAFHSHSRYEIYYFHEGKCNYLIGDKIYVLQPHDLIIMHGMTLHCPHVDSRWPYIRSIVHFDPSFIKEYSNKALTLNVLKPFEELRNYRIQVKEELRDEVALIFHKMNDLYGKKDFIAYNRFLLALIDLMYIVYDLCQKPLETAEAYPSEKERHVQNTITFIEQNYHEDLSLAHFEAGLHLSKYYLSKIFKQVTGLTVFQYVMNRRINQAKFIFLSSKELTITEVCFIVGFKHLSHFSRLFKQYVGCTPEQFRHAGGNGMSLPLNNES